MTGYYNLYLVILSIAIAVIASYTALDLANRVSASESNSRKRWLWLIAGATSLGTGIWAMHFIGMLAFHLPIPVAYDFELTGLSMLIAVAVSAVTLLVLRQREVSLNGRLTAAALMGAGIAAGILCLTLVLSMLDAHFATRNSLLVDSLRLAKEQAETALAGKRRVNEQLRSAQSELLEAARRAGSPTAARPDCWNGSMWAH